MISVMRKSEWRFLGAAAAVLVLAMAAFAVEDRPKTKAAKAGQYDPNAQTVEMFAAMEKGDIAVKLIPKDSTQSKIVIENKTDKPLNIKLPEAFAGVPILGQAGIGAPGVGGGRNRSGGGTNQGNQGIGGGMGGMGGMGGGMFNVPPEAVGKLNVPTVCLDHGKREPRAAIPYEIKPIESYTTKPGVRELCQMLGNGQISRRAAQAAAWHLNNDMTWEQLAAKRLHRASGLFQPYFDPQEIQAGMQAATSAQRTAKEREQEKPSPSRTTPTTPTKSSES
jgi:hypothetical protein